MMAEDGAKSEVGTTLDRILGGRVVLRQSRDGYRAGLDAALLAASVFLRPGQRLIEAGCGPGGALLATAARYPEARLVGVERDAQAAGLARANVAENALTDRVSILTGDVAAGFNALALPAFDAAMANPPFFDDPAVLRGPKPARRGAYLADDGLSTWIAFLIKAVRDGGSITLIHRADRLADILGLLAPKAGSVRVRPIQPFADAAAKRVLVQAIKTGKAPLVLLPPLVLHDRGGDKHRPEIEAILRGEAGLTWD